MADRRRFEVFARFLTDRFPSPRIYDIAGGMGRLNEELTRLGRQVTTFDTRHKHLDVLYAAKEFALNEPCHCDLIVGLHPDGATRIIIEYASVHQIPFAVVPCCSDNSMPYRPWMKFLRELAEGKNLSTEVHQLTLSGRSTVLVGVPDLAPSGTSLARPGFLPNL